MRRISPMLLIALLLTLLAPQPTHAEPDVTIGLLPRSTRDEQLTLRGTAHAGATVAIAVNGELQKRVIAGPSMSVWREEVTLTPGANRITAQLEGTGATAGALIYRITASFDDLADDPYREDVEILATLGLVNGTGDGKFSPGGELTRAALAKMMLSALGLPPDDAPSPFADHIPDWARGYAAAANRHGLVKGFPDRTFRHSSPITRLELAVIAGRGVRAMKVRPEGEGEPFPDQAQVPGWARADLDLALDAGVIGRFLGEELAPERTATRSETAAVMRRLMELHP